MTHNLPKSWDTAEQLEGLKLVPKADLIDEPFRITECWFETNNNGVSYVYVNAETAAGDFITFNDSSTGVRAQLISHLANKGNDHAVDTGEVVPLSLVIPEGLRVSEFTVKDLRGREKLARTYYLTTSGKRAAAPAPAPTKPGRAAASK